MLYLTCQTRVLPGRDLRQQQLKQLATAYSQGHKGMAGWTLGPTIKMGVPTSVKVVKITPHMHAQRSTS